MSFAVFQRCKSLIQQNKSIFLKGAGSVVAANVIYYCLQRPYNQFMQYGQQALTLDGEEEIVPDDHRALVEQTAEKLGLSAHELQQRVVLFVTRSGSSHLGRWRAAGGFVSQYLAGPCRLGLPPSTALLPDEPISVSAKGKSYTIERDSDLGLAMLHALEFSPAALRFLAARDLCALNYSWRNGLPLAAMFTALAGYAPGFYLLQKKIKHPLVLSVWAVGMLPMLSYLCVYAPLTSWFQKRLERVVDEQAALLGPDYAAGGLEVYEKQLAINRVLLEVSGGAKGRLAPWLTPSGNERYRLRDAYDGLSSATRLHHLQQLVLQNNAELTVYSDSLE